MQLSNFIRKQICKYYKGWQNVIPGALIQASEYHKPDTSGTVPEHTSIYYFAAENQWNSAEEKDKVILYRFIKNYLWIKIISSDKFPDITACQNPPGSIYEAVANADAVWKLCFTWSAISFNRQLLSTSHENNVYSFGGFFFVENGEQNGRKQQQTFASQLVYLKHRPMTCTWSAAAS